MAIDQDLPTTPPPGVPYTPTSEDETGRHSLELHAQLEAVDAAPAAPPSTLLDDLADKLAEKMNGNGNGNGHSHPPPPPPKKILGLIEKGDLAKLVIGWVIAIAVFLGAWYKTVNAEIAKKATEEDVREIIKWHNNTRSAHPAVQIQLDGLKKEQRTIRESQIRQETIDEVQTKALERIEKKLDRRSRPGRGR
jgi:hypothetical protein